MTVEYATGERFVGDPLTVTQKIGEAHVNTKVWARQQRAQQSQQTTEPMQLNQHTAQPTEQTASGSLADDLATRQADAIARQLGFNDLTEAKQSILEMGRVKEQVQKFEEQELAARFHATQRQTSPTRKKAAETVMQIIGSNGWQPNLESLQAAHALAMQESTLSASHRRADTDCQWYGAAATVSAGFRRCCAGIIRKSQMRRSAHTTSHWAIFEKQL